MATKSGFRFQLGLKLWSINENYITEARRLFEEGVCQYIELYAVPNSFDQYKDQWVKLKDITHVPFIIHAPHFKEGMNLALKEKESSNTKMVEEARKFADALEAQTIIYHPGISGDINETIRQITLMNDKRVVVENKPYFAIDRSAICNGYAPEDIQRVMELGHVGFCLDVGHAICAANAIKEDPRDYLARFMALKPTMYHLTDGDYQGVIDRHQHIGEGTFPLCDILKGLPSGCRITNEANKDSTENLRDFDEDIKRLKRCFT